MSSIEIAIQQLQNGNSKEGIRTLANLKSQPLPPKQTLYFWTLLLFDSPFKFLALEAARTEFKIHGCKESKDLAIKLAQDSVEKRQNNQEVTTKISIIGYLTASSVASWRRCFESLQFQYYNNYELCLVSTEKIDAQFPTDVMVFHSTGSRLDAYQLAIQNCSGEIITIVEEPKSIFADNGLYIVGSVFASNPHLSILQTERLYLGSGDYPQSMRFNLPEWDQSTLLDEGNIASPTMNFSWQGVFFRKATLQSALPFDRMYPNAAALEVASRLILSHSFYTISACVIASRIQIHGKGPLLSLKETGESLLIINKEKRKYSNLVSSPRPQQDIRRKNMKAPEVNHQILIRGEISNKRISLVTASFNCKEFIEPCIQSILNQNYKNLEFIVLDGGSTDGTLEILKKYEKYFSFFRSAPDGGHYAAVQEGLNKASGDILTWLNADDLLLPYTFRLISDVFCENTQMEWITGMPALITEQNELDISSQITDFSPKLFLDDEFDDPLIQQEGTFWTKRLWKKAGSSLDLRLKLAADMELWTRFFQISPVYSCTLPLGIFRKRKGQRSDIFRKSYFQEAVAVTDRLKITGAVPAYKDPNENYIVRI